MKKIIYTLVSLAVLSACSSKLDIPQHGVLSRDTYYQSDEEVEGGLTALYVSIAGKELAHKMVLNLLSDDEWAGAVDVNEFHFLNDFTFDAEHPYVGSFFTDFYNTVGRCNVLIDNITPDTPFKKQALAEAKVARAWMYFYLTALWGTPPLVDHCLSADETNVPNASREKLWEFIEKDLRDAISSEALTSKKSPDDRDNYRITREFAYAILGKVLLWEKKYEESALAFDKVIGSGLYKLFDGNYGDMVLGMNDNNCESLFESNFLTDDAVSGAAFRLYPMAVSVGIATRPDVGSNVFDLNPAGWGMCVPTKSLYDAFVAEEGADGYRLNQSIKTYAFMKENGYGIMPGAVEIGEGFFLWKDRYVMADAGPGYPMDWGNNVRWMRYAEVLLLAAEANLEAGHQDKADACLKEVRDRAGLPVKAATLEVIKLEKRLELCGEACRYMDLVRWGDAATVLGNQGATFPYLSSDGSVDYRPRSSTYGFKAGKHELLPFPASEKRINNQLKQNNNW